MGTSALVSAGECLLDCHSRLGGRIGPLRFAHRRQRIGDVRTRRDGVSTPELMHSGRQPRRHIATLKMRWSCGVAADSYGEMGPSGGAMRRSALRGAMVVAASALGPAIAGA